jgi:hypothetical protein
LVAAVARDRHAWFAGEELDCEFEIAAVVGRGGRD